MADNLMGQQTPELILDNYYQRNMERMDQQFRTQWDEVNKRAPQIGQRKQYELLNEIQANARTEVNKFHNMMTERMQQLRLADQLGEQGGFDTAEAKWRMVLGSEMEGAMFPKGGQSAIERFRELEGEKYAVEKSLEDFRVIPGAYKKKYWSTEKGGWPWGQEERKPGRLNIWDPNIKGKQDRDTGEWSFGGYRPTTPEETELRALLGREQRAISKEITDTLAGQPGLATRVRGPMTRRLRGNQGSLADKVKLAMPVQTPAPAPVPRAEKQLPTAEQLRKAGTKGAYETGIELGYWE